MTEGTDLAEVVAALRAVPGVADADVEPDGEGAGLLRLDLAPGVDEAQVAARVGRLLLERFGIGIDAERVQLVEHADLGRAAPAPAGQRRLSIRRMELVSSGTDVTATVTLADGDAASVGEATGSADQQGVHEALATATLRAVEHALDGRARLELESVELAVAAGEHVVLVLVTMVDPGGSERLSGSATVRDDARQACIRAALDAVNRRISPLLG